MKTLLKVSLILLLMISTASFARPWVNFIITNKTGGAIFVRYAGQTCIHDGDKLIQVQDNPGYATYQKMHHDKIKVGNGDTFQIEYDMDEKGGYHYKAHDTACDGRSALKINIFNAQGDKLMRGVGLKFIKRKSDEYATKITNGSQKAYLITPVRGQDTAYVGTLKSL